MRVRRKSGFGATLGVLSLALVALGGDARVAAAGDTFRIEPAVTSVAKDATFDVRVVQRAAAAVSGAQSTITFDPSLVQVKSVTVADPYADAPVFVGAGVEAIGLANDAGRLSTVAAAFLPPLAVPAGDQDFLIVRFKAIGCGETQLGLPVGPADAALLDGTAAGYGNPVSVSTAAGTIAVCSNPSTTSDASAPGSPAWPIVLVGLVVAAAITVGLRSMRRAT